MKQSLVANFIAAIASLLLVWLGIESGDMWLVFIMMGMCFAFVGNGFLSVWLLINRVDEPVPQIEIPLALFVQQGVAPEEILDELAHTILELTQPTSQESDGMERGVSPLRSRGGQVHNLH